MRESKWVKVEANDGGEAFLLTTDGGLAKAFASEQRALVEAEAYIGCNLERRSSGIGELIYFAEVV